MYRKSLVSLTLSCLIGLLLGVSCGPDSSEAEKASLQKGWPPSLPKADENGVATLKTNDLLRVPAEVQAILDSTDARLKIAKNAPQVELAYHKGLRHIPADSSGALWSSWGEICLASDGKVYSGTGNHWGMDRGETYIYCWDPAAKVLSKVADVNEILGAQSGDPRFSKVHAPIFEGRDKNIYFTGTLDNGGLAGVSPNLEAWNEKITGGKLFQYDPLKEESIVFADLPPATVTATTLYDPERNYFYCELEGSPDGISFAVLDMTTKKWVYKSEPGMVSHHRNMMMDTQGNVYFNGPRITLSESERKALQEKRASQPKTSMLPLSERHRAIPEAVTPLWKYDPSANTVAATQSSTVGGIRSSTRESGEGFIYGTTMNDELFKYNPKDDEMTILGSNFLMDGEYITVCVLSPDEKYVYYLPGAHGSAGFSGTPVIQYDIENNEQKALVFLSETMEEQLGYSPGGTYGLKISDDGSVLYVGLNGSPADTSMVLPKGFRKESGFGLTSFASIYIPQEERSGE